jgi:hypothetical protein
LVYDEGEVEFFDVAGELRSLDVRDYGGAYGSDEEGVGVSGEEGRFVEVADADVVPLPGGFVS